MSLLTKTPLYPTGRYWPALKGMIAFPLDDVRDIVNMQHILHLADEVIKWRSINHLKHTTEYHGYRTLCMKYALALYISNNILPHVLYNQLEDVYRDTLKEKGSYDEMVNLSTLALSEFWCRQQEDYAEYLCSFEEGVGAIEDGDLTSEMMDHLLGTIDIIISQWSELSITQLQRFDTIINRLYTHANAPLYTAKLHNDEVMVTLCDDSIPVIVDALSCGILYYQMVI